MRIRGIFTALFLAMICLATASTVNAETLTTTVFLSPANVVPPVTGLNASGTLTLTFDVNRAPSGNITGGSVNFVLLVNFPGPVTVTGFPLREGSATTNGPEVINVDGNSTNVFGTGVGKIDLSMDITDTALLRRLIANPAGFYINLNTMERPMGALRGQLSKLVESRANTLALTTIAVVDPPTPVRGGASGTATITVHPTRNPDTGVVTGGTVSFAVFYSFSGGITVTGLRIHEGAAGTNGPVVIDTGAGGSSSIVSAGGQGAINIVVPVNGADSIGALQRLLANPANFYVNLLTSTNPAGALRGQLRALAQPPGNFIASSYTLAPTDVAQMLALTGVTEDGSVSVLVNGMPAIFAFDQPGRISVQIQPSFLLSLSGLLFVQLQNANGLLSEPVIVVVAAPERINATAPTAVDAARFGQAVAPDSIATAFGTNLATQTAVASRTPLQTSLDDTRVYVNGRLAPLFFVSAGQINFQTPPETLPGSPVSLVIVNKNGVVSRGTMTVSSTAAGIFTRKSDGTGAPAGVASTDGQNFNIGLSNPDGTPVAIDAGNFVVLFGTGLRFRSGPVGISIGGMNVTPLFAGAQGQLVSLDQINLQIPAALAGKGDVDLELTVDGKKSNAVKLRIK